MPEILARRTVGCDLPVLAFLVNRCDVLVSRVPQLLVRVLRRLVLRTNRGVKYVRLRLMLIQRDQVRLVVVYQLDIDGLEELLQVPVRMLLFLSDPEYFGFWNASDVMLVSLEVPYGALLLLALGLELDISVLAMVAFPAQLRRVQLFQGELLRVQRHLQRGRALPPGLHRHSFSIVAAIATA